MSDNMIGIKEQIESILLLGGDEIKIKDLSKFFELPVERILQLLAELRVERFNTGINIEVEQDVVHLITNPRCGEVINRYFQQDLKPRKLSNAALETISIIAYKQPITKSEIESIRGVSADGMVNTLEERKLIRSCGRKDAIGRPHLYEITDKFLDYLGIASVEELPQYNELKEKLSGGNEDK